uniref:PARP-type domain-containing protein n=1 Tax=Grammatophora oceanica TaxID=210454 RepID=A0A7S1UZF2_9STRA|mmetsp:Transcript_30986/g.45961  ORF Transcript_30986/g.45961 Transcript_30986/m.45961 type:complete len:176 (+) Transcript_30986:57-584(+)
MADTDVDPSTLLPRDATGRYLHLKLKRFPSVKDLSMPFAKKTWKEIPHHAEAEVSPSKRSKCRWCHETIQKGDLRMRLWLQCHKGCKMSAYFHGDSCIWEYPETAKLEKVDEIVGWKKLPEKQRKVIKEKFEEMRELSISSPDLESKASKASKPSPEKRAPENGIDAQRKRRKKA